MANEFIDPAVQQNLEKLLSALQGEQERLAGILSSAQEAVTQFEGLSAEAYAAQLEQARTLGAVKTPPGEGSIAEATAAIREEAAALTEVNQLIAQQIKLQAEAAAAARTTATAQVGGTGNTVLDRLATRSPDTGALSQQAQSATRQAEQERLVELARTQAASESQIGASLERNILIYSQADNVLQRHGALTTDFINAAGRGEVTLKEFGDQVGATIGKFAGWTGAAAAVYGVYGAVTELARGAIDAASTVQQLHRTIDGLDNQQAGQAIIQLAHDTNTSMKEAGDAVFLFSRTFPNLQDAVYAAGLALRAFKLDGVSVTDQVKAQTAIHQQFGISARGLGPIYDELAAGQREYNARITDQIPLLQRSASAVKNAGGDLRTFIELSTIALRTTQLSGSQLGTAFLRSAATFLNPATTKGQSGRAVLASLGIDPNQNYTSLILDALKKAATLSNSQRQELSLAVFGPLLGGRTAGFFTGGPSLLDEVQQKLSPQAVHGSFLTEFAKELATPSQQIKQLGTNLQQLGAELGQAGLLAPLGLVVKGTNDLLTLSREILGVWTQLPTPVKEVAGLVAGLYAARAVTQKTGLTGVPFFGRSGEQVDRAQISAGLNDQQAFFQQQYTSTARSAATATLATQNALLARNAAVASGTDEQIAAAQTAYERALVRQLGLEQQAAALQAQTLATKEQLNAFQARLNEGLSAEEAATAVGINYRLTTLARGTPVANPVAAVGGGGSDGFSKTPSGLLIPAGATASVSQLEQQAKTAGEEAPKFAQAMGKAGSAVGGVVEAIPGASAALATGATVLGSASEAASGLVSKVGGWVPAMLLAGFAFSELNAGEQALTDAMRQFGQDIQAENQAQNFEQLKAAVQQAADNLKQQRSDIQGGGIPIIGGVIKDLTSAVESVTGGTHGVANLFGAYDKLNRSSSDQAATRGYADAFEQLYNQAVADSKNVKGTQESRDRWYQQLRSLESQAVQFAAGSKNADAPLKTLRTALQGLYETLQSGFKVLPVSGSDPFAQFKTQDPKNIVQGIQAIADRIKLYGADPGSLAQIATAYTYLAQKYAGSSNDQALQQVTSAQSLFVDAVKKDAQDLIDQADVASTPAERAALLGQARALIETAKAKIAAAAAPVRAQVAQLQAAYAADVAALAAAGKVEADSNDAVAQGLIDHARAVGGLTGVIDSSVGEVLKSVDAATNFEAQRRAAANSTKQKLDASQKALAELGNADRQITGQLDQQLKTINTASTGASDPFELVRLRREIQQARDQGNPVKAAQDAEALARDEIASAQTEKDRLQGILDLANAEAQLNKAIADRTQAYYSYLSSTTEDPIKQAQYDIAGANAAVSSAISTGGTGTQAYFEALQKLNESQQKLAKGIEDRRQAYYTFAESQTRDPVKQATFELAAATDAVNYAVKSSGTGSQAYYEAKAKQNDAKNKLFDAHLTVSEDNIQFGLDLNRISTQTALNEYEQLLKLHNLTLQQRQDLLRKIDALKKGSSSDFSDLDLGTIRLPTPYEIRRAVLAAQSYGASTITNHNDITIQVPDERAANAVGVVMDRYVTGTHKAVQRARGAR